MKYLPSIRRGNRTPLRLWGRKALSSRVNSWKSVVVATLIVGPFVSAAPGDVILVLDLHDARIVGVVADRVAIVGPVFKGDRRRLDMPLQAVVAPSHVQTGETSSVFKPKHRGEAIAEGNHCAVVDAEHVGKRATPDDRVRRVPPHNVASSRAGVLAREWRQATRRACCVRIGCPWGRERSRRRRRERIGQASEDNLTEEKESDGTPRAHAAASGRLGSDRDAPPAETPCAAASSLPGSECNSPYRSVQLV